MSFLSFLFLFSLRLQYWFLPSLAAEHLLLLWKLVPIAPPVTMEAGPQEGGSQVQPSSGPLILCLDCSVTSAYLTAGTAQGNSNRLYCLGVVKKGSVHRQLTRAGRSPTLD